ncbi:E3 ubiquitin-protein ligase TRIM71-like [Mytilus edulis]|uniref:E3 ubiquitin-protein ligase TRIM71-like n=1 Tax=Mytilus edulis TaxID=6550 RepID=UPI0039EF3715
MANNESASFCVICQSRDLNKLAEEYCPQCEEVLCGDCQHHHKTSKSTKSHQTIPIENYKKLPSFIKQITHNCKEHDCFLEFYCKSHESFCCKICLISGHKECKETIFIEDFLKPLPGHQSAALDNIEKVLQDLQSNICSAIKDRNRNLTELREQKRVIEEQIKEKRKEINNLLDNLEEELLQKVSIHEKTNCREIEEIITKLEDEKEKVDEIQKEVESVKMFASNLQIFMGTKTFQESISTNEINVQQAYDNGSLNNVTMKCTFSEKLEGFIKHIKTFGDVEIDNSEKHVSFSWKGDKSAQNSKPMSVAKSIENIYVRLGSKIDINHDGISGCAISEAGNMLFLQAHCNRMMKYAPNGEFISESRINPEANGIGYDLAVIDSNTVAVSSGGNTPQQIYLIDMKSTNMSQVLQLGDWCYGLSYSNDSFICCTYHNGIKIYDRSNSNVRILPNSPKSAGDTYVASNANCIFHTNWRDDSVVCYDFSGQVKWKYMDSSLLKKPYGITLDTNSNIYVAGSDSNNVVVISPDGKQAKELIGASDKLTNPRALFFHKTKPLLLVANYNNGASVYDVI